MFKTSALFILLLTGVCFYQAHGQTGRIVELRGEVKDSLSGQPLAYAHVKIKDKALGIPTNSEGQFVLPLPHLSSSDTLVISLMGYASKKVAGNRLTGKNFHTFLMAENSILLEEVEINTQTAENIIREVASRIKTTFPTQPFELEGYYRNAYKEFSTYVKQVEVAFNGFDGNFHHRNGHSVHILNKRESPDFRKFQWRQAQGNLPWHNLWRFRQQHQHFFTGKPFQKYTCSLEEITYLEGEKVYKLTFIPKDQSKKITRSWAYIRASDYAILEIGGKTTIVNPQKFQLADTLFMAYIGGSVLVKYASYKGKMYPSYSKSVYQHEVYNRQTIRQGNFDMQEELIVHEVNTASKYSTKRAFEQGQQAKMATLPPDSTFWKQYTRPVETLLSRTIEKDLAFQRKSLAMPVKTPENSYTLEPIAVEKLRADFTLFRNSLEEAHPSLYRYTSKQELDNLFQSAYQSLTQPLSEMEFYRLLTPVLAKIRCGHTGSSPPEKYVESYYPSKVFLPIQTTCIGGKLYAVKMYDTRAKTTEGNEILFINGLAVEDITHQILPHLTADGYITSSKYKQLAKNFVILYSYYIAHADTFEIISRNRTGQTDTVRVPAISYQNYLAWTQERKKENTFSFLDAQTALLTVATFTDTGNQIFTDWMDDTVNELLKRKVHTLIIDLRGNEGGRDDYAMYLLSFLAKAPFRYQVSLQAATNQFSFLSYTNQHAYLNSQMQQIVQKDAAGNFMLKQTHPTLKLTTPKANSFTGKVYFLIDGETFSAAADFAALAKELKLGVFIGEETGGAAEGNTSNGEILLTLPHSGIRIGIPLFRITNAVSFPHSSGRGVIPDYQTDYTIDEYIHALDKEIALVKKFIAESAK